MILERKGRASNGKISGTDAAFGERHGLRFSQHTQPPLNHTGEAMTCFTSSQDQVHGLEETGWNNPSYYRIILLQEGGIEGTK